MTAHSVRDVDPTEVHADPLIGPPSGRLCATPRPIRVASYNIHKCVGPDGRRDPLRVMRVLAELNADVVALQETERKFGTARSMLNADRLRLETGYSVLRGYAPEPACGGVGGWHGNAILVRGAVRSHTHFEIPLPSLEPRGAVIAEIDLGGAALRVVAAHFGLVGRWRRKQAAAIVRHLINTRSGPTAAATVLMGDLNEWMPRARSIRVLEDFFGYAAPIGRSFPSSLPMFALDRIFASPRRVLDGFQVHDTPAARVASDHLPVTAVIDTSFVSGGSPC